MIISAMRLREN